MISSAARRDATPAWARYLARRIRWSSMDLELLQRTLDDLGEPRFRAGQVWSWVARGASSYDEMSNVGAALRSEVAARGPFSSLTVEHGAHASGGTGNAVFHSSAGRPLGAGPVR